MAFETSPPHIQVHFRCISGVEAIQEIIATHLEKCTLPQCTLLSTMWLEVSLASPPTTTTKINIIRNKLRINQAQHAWQWCSIAITFSRNGLKMSKLGWVGPMSHVTAKSNRALRQHVESSLLKLSSRKGTPISARGCQLDRVAGLNWNEGKTGWVLGFPNAVCSLGTSQSQGRWEPQLPLLAAHAHTF